jgi:hypothetical protein
MNDTQTAFSTGGEPPNGIYYVAEDFAYKDARKEHRTNIIIGLISLWVVFWLGCLLGIYL